MNNKNCFFLNKKIKYVDYRDIDLLNKFINPNGKILPKKRTGLSAKYQRKVDLAIKRARYMALIPYIKQ